MSKTPILAWIDDSVDRKRVARKTADSLEMELAWIHTYQKEIQSVIGEIEDSRLIIIDQFLTDASREDFAVLGSTLAEVIRDQYQKIPIVGVTAKDNDPKITTQRKRQFDVLIRADKLHEEPSKSLIRSLMEGYSLLSRSRLTGPEAFVRLLCPPSSEVPRLLSAMPTDLKDRSNYPYELGDGGRVIKRHSEDYSIFFQLTMWVLHTLLSRPGFLYDKVWASTKLGIKETALHKIHATISPAMFSGIFSDDLSPHYWASELGRLVNQKVCPDEPTRLSDLGRCLTSIAESDHSFCWACDSKLFREPPETVALVDRTENAESHPMHLRCTEEHPDYQKSLYFEDIRVMRDDDED